MVPTVSRLLLMVSLFAQSIYAVPPVIISNPSDVNATLGSTITFSCTVENADFIVWFVNGSLNAEHNQFNGTVRIVRQQGIELTEELQLKAMLLLNNSEVSCTAGNVQAELVSSSRARVLVQGALAAVGGISSSELTSSLLVSWTAPYTLDGVPILGYNITVSGVHTGVSTALASSTTIELDISTSCDNFTITVVPLNAVGNGLPAVTTVNNLQEPSIDASSIVTEVAMMNGFPQVNISLKITHNCQGDLNDYVQTQYNGVTDLAGPFRSADGRITFTVGSLPQNSLFPLSMRVENEGGISSQHDVPISTYDVQSIDAIYNREQNTVCVTCTFMVKSVAAGCAAKISKLNTTSEVTLQVARTNGEQQITGCAPNFGAGQYRVEVFDVEAGGQLAQTAAIVMDFNENTGGSGTPQPSISLPTIAVQPSQTPTRATVPDTPASGRATIDQYEAIRYAAIALSTIIIALCIAIAIVILCYVYKQRVKQTRPVTSRRHSLSSRSRSRQSNEYEDHSLPTLQAARQLPTVQLSNSVNQPPSSHGSTPALPPRNYYLDESGNLDVPSVAGQSVTDLESVSGWLRAQEPNRSTTLDDQYLDEEEERSPVKVPVQELAAARRRPRENVPWYAADSTDGPLLLREEEEQDEEEPPPYEVTLTGTPRKTSTQSTASTPQRGAGSMTYAELDFTHHSQRKTSLTSATNSRTQLLAAQPNVDYAVVRKTRRNHHSQYATVNSLV